MSTVYQELAERIRGELPDLERLMQRTQDAWVHAHRWPEEFAYLDSAALNLHGFYSGLERLFELIARHVDGQIPAGKTWHRDLLRQMAQDIEDVRPAVIGQSSMQALDELRRFRHLVRNVYTTNLSPDRMANLISSLPKLWPRLRAELLAFAEFLEAFD
ncbi:MAG: antitoxin [Chloroflexi bacterium]|nr:antitoxin [Chloroflexota bacterium]